MAKISASFHSLHVGEYFALALGLGLTSLAVSARVYTKMRLTKVMRKEDYLSVLAWLSFLAYMAIAVVIGKHKGSAEHIAHLSSIESAIYCPIIMLVKVSILLQYITLFVIHRRTAFHYAVLGLVWTNILYYIIATVVFLTECTPIQKLWKPNMPGHCSSRHNGGVASGVMNVISDFTILILPLPIIWRLQMPLGKKSRVVAVFDVGLFACIASVLRLVYSLELTEVPFSSPAYQLDIDRIGLWAFAEIAIGIIVGCLPVLPRFFKHFTSKEAGSSSRRFEVLTSASRTLWRRFLHRSGGTPASSRREASYHDRKNYPGKPKPQMSATAPPRIETLNLTRNSIHLEGGSLPRMPSPTHDKGSSLPETDGMSICYLERNETKVYETIADVEKAIPAAWI